MCDEEYQANLDTLDADSLLQICDELSFKDQHSLSRVNDYLQDVVHCWWQFKYAKAFNAEKVKLKILSNKEQKRVLAAIAPRTREFQKLRAVHCDLLYDTKTSYPNVEVVSVKERTERKKRTMLDLKHFTKTFPNIKKLSLLSSVLTKPANEEQKEALKTLFRQLNTFVLLPLEMQCYVRLPNDLMFGDTLQDLRLPANMLSVHHMGKIAKMKQLRTLTLYDDHEGANWHFLDCFCFIYVPMRYNSPLLQSLVEELLRVARLAGRQITDLQFKCQIDTGLAEVLLDAQYKTSLLSSLKRLTWGSRFRHVYYKMGATFLWRPHDMEVQLRMFKFMKAATNLETIDLRSNIQIQSIDKVLKMLGGRAKGMTVLHDSDMSKEAVHREETDTIETGAESKQAYVKFTFSH